MTPCKLFQGFLPRCFIQLGRFGDLLAMLPMWKALHDLTNEKPAIIVSRNYASVLEGASYVTAIPLDLHWIGGVEKAKKFATDMFGNRVVTQCHGSEWSSNPNISYHQQMWDHAGFLDAFGKLPLVLDQRNAARENILASHYSKKPMILVKFNGVTSPFAAAPEVMRALAPMEKHFQFVDLGHIQATRIYDLLGLYDKAVGMITSDTVTLHLAPASKIPYVALIANGPAGSVPLGNCVLKIPYGQSLRRINEIVQQVDLWRNGKFEQSIEILAGPRYSISVIAFNNLSLTYQCVSAILAHSEDYELILTNNGSTDGTQKYFNDLAAKHKFVRVVHNEKNLGYKDPCANAFAISKGEYFVTVNNDGIVSRGWLKALEEPFKTNPNAALVGVQGNGWWSLTDDFKAARGKMDYVEGSCMMAKASVLRKHGISSSYLEFAYCEDSDLSLRLREQGYSLHLVPVGFVHKHAQTSRSVPGISDILEQNRQVMLKRWRHYLKVRRMDYPIVIRRRDATGDILLTTPIIAALKSQRPRCPIYVECRVPEIFLNNPHVAGAHQAIVPDGDAMVLDLNMSYEMMANTHIVDGYGQIAYEYGLFEWTKRTELYPTEEQLRIAQKMHPEGKWVALHMGPTTWNGKNWPIDRWREVVGWLAERDWKIMLVGGAADYGIFPAHANYCGHTTILTLAALLNQCQLFIGLDSFPMHAAQAMGVPVIALFGATLPEYVFTDGSRSLGVKADPKISCAGVRHRQIGQTQFPCDGDCMKSITTEMVIDAIQSFV